MIKRILLLAAVSCVISTSVFAFGLGSLGLGSGKKAGDEQKVPVSERIQTVDYKYVSDIVAASDQADYLHTKSFRRFIVPAECVQALKANKALPADCVKDEREAREVKLGNLKTEDQPLYDLISTIMLNSAEEFKIRSVPEETNNKFFKFLTENGFDNLGILLLNTAPDDKQTSARYFPEGKVALLGIQSARLAEPAYRAEVGFLVAHEMGHALGLHVLEDKTAASDTSGNISDATQIGLDVAVDSFYSKLDPSLAKLIDESALMLSGIFLQPDDLTNDDLVMKGRNESSAVALATKFGQSDKVRLLGAGLTVPSTTRVVVKKMMASGMETAQVLDVLKNGTDAAAYMLNSASHSKDQEFEADQIGFHLARKAKLDQKDILTFLEGKAANEPNSGSLIGGHPAMQDRIKNLKKAYNL